jgi:hypothetical protein
MDSQAKCGYLLPRHFLLLLVLLSTLSGSSAAQIWVASAGTVDEDSSGTISFVGGFAQLRSTVSIGSATLRYNVLPLGTLVQQITEPCCEGRALVVRYRDNGPGAQVIVTLKRYNVHTGAVSTLLTFDSNSPPQQSDPQFTGFQEPVPTINEADFFNFSFAEGPTEGPQDRGGDSTYYVEARLIRSAPEGNPGLASVRIVTVLAP